MTLLDLRHYIRVYDGNLTPEMCQRMVQSFHALARFHAPNGRGRPGLDNSAWTELNVTRFADTAFLGFFRIKIDKALDQYNDDLGLGIRIPNTPKTSDLMLKRYRKGGLESFEPHFDSINEVANRYLVLLWYLNDVEEGGDTRFPQLELSIRPKAGRLLVFPPYWMYQHEGRAPLSGDKFIVSTYLLF